MTITQRREKSKETFAKVPIMMLQGSAEERIKRSFTRQDPTPPLKLTDLHYAKNGHQELNTVFHDCIRVA